MATTHEDLLRVCLESDDFDQIINIWAANPGFVEAHGADVFCHAATLPNALLPSLFKRFPEFAYQTSRDGFLPLSYAIYANQALHVAFIY